MNQSKTRYLALIVFAILLTVVDQITKQWAYNDLLGQPAIHVLPVFQLALVFNKGAAFGFLNDAGGWQHWLFVSLAVVFSVILVIWIWRESQRNSFLAIGLSLVLAGAIGNLIDRVTLGFVIDFLILHYNNWYFPAFNVADVCITFGAVILIFDSLFFSKH